MIEQRLSGSELREAINITKQLLNEAAAKGSLDDFWVVVDCDSKNFRDYVHRSNTQGLIDIICKNHKSLCTRKRLNNVALFASGDKDKAEKEAKQRAKNMKIELVSESEDCQDCKDVRDNQMSVVHKNRRNSVNINNKDLKSRLLQKADYEEKLAKTAKCRKCKTISESVSCVDCLKVREDHKKVSEKSKAKLSIVEDPTLIGIHKRKVKEYSELAKTAKCEKCSKSKVDENYYNPRNVASSEQTLGASTDDTVYGNSSAMKIVRPYEPSENDAMDTERDQKVTVPLPLIALLTAKSKAAKEYGEKLAVHHTEDKQFYSDLSQMFDDLNNYLKSGSVHDIKMASTFLTSLMGPMLYEIPTEVVRFITHGGAHAPLKTFMNSVTDPKGGFDIDSQTHKNRD